MPAIDVLVIGSGIAGLSAAIKIGQRFPDRKVCVVTKSALADSNTQFAQGGISVVTDFVHDSLESHIQDTLQAGDGLCNERVVRFVVERAGGCLDDLIDLGVEFDRVRDGQLSLGREGGHQHHRIVHCKDATGASISSALLSRIATLSNIMLLANHAVIDLIGNQPGAGRQHEKNSCYGALVLDQIHGEVRSYFAQFTIMATGGVGQLYDVTTNPVVATGDGIAIAWRAGARVSNMEFIQFHPTALACFDTSPCFLISEAVRGHGAHLINESGERFMFRYHIDGELACRDVVARAIATEIAAGRSVYLDCTPIATDFQDKFPTIYNKCVGLGLDLGFDPVPVVPAAHYLCGGIDVDLNARTTVDNLYACGECANTGLHGANRLASNSLLEAMVFAHACYDDIAARLGHTPARVDTYGLKTVVAPNERQRAVLAETKAFLKNLMTDHAAIVRSNRGLAWAAGCLTEIKHVVEGLQHAGIIHHDLYELINMVDVAVLIVDQSKQRRENCGGHFNRDLVRREEAIPRGLDQH